MNTGSFKNIIYKVCFQIIYTYYMYLAYNNQQ